MQKNFIIGIDLGGTNLKIGLLDLNYRIKKKEVLSTKRFVKKEELILAIVDSINNLIKHCNLKKTNIFGVGLGLPGPIDVKKGLVHFFPNISGWHEVNLRQILERKLNLPVALDNDANLMCLAEYRLGAARGYRNVICLTLGTGVGGGIIIESRLYRGANFAAGEIGHIPINESGPKCNCGGSACLESYIGNKQIEKKAKELFKRDISLEEVSAMAKKNNSNAKAIWREAAGHLGKALVGVVNMLNPDCIVIGGGVSNAGRVLFDNVRKVISAQAMTVQARQVRILKAKLGNDAGIIGAAILVHGYRRSEFFRGL